MELTVEVSTFQVVGDIHISYIYVFFTNNNIHIIIILRCFNYIIIIIYTRHIIQI